MRADARETGGGGPLRRVPGAQGDAVHSRAGGGEAGLPGRLDRGAGWTTPNAVALDHSADLGWAGDS